MKDLILYLCSFYFMVYHDNIFTDVYKIVIYCAFLLLGQINPFSDVLYTWVTAVRLSADTEHWFIPLSFHTAYGPHRTFSKTGVGAFFLEVKRPGREANH
jgi:hypothetical protein